jgi:hypothetical protein
MTLVAFSKKGICFELISSYGRNGILLISNMLPCKESNCVYGLIISGNIYEILWRFIKLIFNSNICTIMPFELIE